jgi:alpha-tubulin suppressor-like RCC1 family protein
MIVMPSSPAYRLSLRHLALGLMQIATAASIALVSLPAESAHAAPPSGRQPQLPPGSQVFSWGSNADGALGTGNIAQAQPTLVPNVSAVSASTEVSHGLAVSPAGLVFAWGKNDAGQIGNGGGSSASVTSPVSVPELTNVKAVAAGGSHSVALLSDGTVWTWGSNSAGELGQGRSIASSATPAEVVMSNGSPLTNVMTIAAGYTHGLALRTDGSVWTWGSNTYGQLGDGTGNPVTADKSYHATQVITTAGTPLSGVSDIAAGGDQSYALQAPPSAGALPTVFGWGRIPVVTGLSNQPGYTTVLRTPCGTIYLSTPCDDRARSVLSVPGLTHIAAGGLHGLAVANGQVYGWGWNIYGQLGDGTTQGREAPVLASGLSGVRTVAGGQEHTVVLMTDGTVRGMGLNFGTTAVAVAGLTNIRGVAGGQGFSLAVSNPPKPVSCLILGCP